MIHLILVFILIQALGAAGFAWSSLLFKDLPDRGYGVAKVMGLLLVAYAYWALVTARVLENGLLSLLAVLLLLAGASAILARQQREELLLFIRTRWRLLAAHEAVFLLAFVAFTAFRVLVPDVTVTTAITGITTEQPMDLAFLSGSLRSPVFPAADPWLAGHSISYYYFGYLAFSIPAHVAGAAPAVAYNLALITLFSLAAVAVFSLTTNAIILSGLTRRRLPRLDPLMITGGVVSVVLLLVAGNLAGGWGAVARLAEAGFPNGDWNWWWSSTRVIIDGTGTNPIDEIPAFSFVLGDLHPHVMAIPFALLALTVSLSWLAKTDAPDAGWPAQRIGDLFLTGLIIGALGFVNAWDMPVYMAVLAAAILIRRLWDTHAPDAARLRDVARDAAAPAAAILAVGLVLFLPFYLTVGSSIKGVLPLAVSGTGLRHYFVLWAPLLVAVPPAVTYAWTRVGAREVRTRVVVGAGALAATPLILWTFVAVGWSLLPVDIPGAATPPGISVMVSRWTVALPAVTVAGAALIAVVPPRWGGRLDHPGMVFSYLLVLAGAVAIVVPEVFFVWDLFGSRMNTVFKMHYQAWLLLSVGAGVGAVWLLRRPVPAPGGARAVLVGGAMAALAVFMVTATYGPAAAATRAFQSESRSFALDGLSGYRAAYPDDAAAIRWLHDNAPSGAVVLEAVGGDYSDHGRVSAITGIPTLLGWESHELQWRGGTEQFGERRAHVTSIYTGMAQPEGEALQPDELARLIAFYDIDYVFIGTLEREAYGADTAERLIALLPEASVAHRSGDTVILFVPELS